MPIGYVELGKDEVTTPLETDDMLTLPGFEGNELERGFEARLRAALDARLTGPRRFERPDFRSAA